MRLKKFLDKIFKTQNIHVVETSNIIQLDDLGYPLMLCIMSNGEQAWIDINVKTAEEGIKNRTFYFFDKKSI